MAYLSATLPYLFLLAVSLAFVTIVGARIPVSTKEAKTARLAGKVASRTSLGCFTIGETCTGGLKCAGTEGALVCVYPMSLGQPCGQDPYWVCQDGLDCRDGSCQHPIVQDCTTLGCEAGKKCAGPAGGLVCVDPMPEGQNCGQDPYWVCQDGIDCADGICRNPIPQDCSTLGCEARKKCVGPAGGLVCVDPMPEGQNCGQDPYRVCQDGLDCTDGICRNPIPQDCSTLGCEAGKKCAGPAGGLVCVDPMPEGQNCGQDPYWVCQDGLGCTDGICRNPIPQDCSTLGCEAGKKCAGPAGGLVCVDPMPEGQNCGQDPYWVCQDGLGCTDGICRNPIPQDCSTLGCEAGKKCAGPAGGLVCVDPMPEGQNCGQDPYWVCQDGLDCTDGICRNPIPQDCSTLGCEAGKKCVGPAGGLVCVDPMPEGQNCGQDPYWVCQDGLGCTDGICRNPIPQDCSTLGCEAGKKCAGPAGGLVCVDPMPEGQNCGQDPYWVCQDGIDCTDGICRNPISQDCSTLGCEAGKKCAGPAGGLVCVDPMPEGEACGQDPYWVCQDGLECQNEVCRKPEVGPVGDCSNGETCTAGTICAGSTGEELCVKPMGEGGQCDVDPYWICEEGLECRDLLCKKADVPKGGDCNFDGAVCVDGMVCAGPSGQELCVTPMMDGETCGVDPYWVCKDGFTCEETKCRRLLVPRGGDCKREGSVCEDGLVCTGNRRMKCRKPVPEGKKCGRDPFWWCKEGLTCVHSICVK